MKLDPITEYILEKDRKIKEQHQIVNLFGDKFPTDAPPDMIKRTLPFLKKNYKKAKEEAIKYIKGDGMYKVEGARNIKPDNLILDWRGGPYFQLEWEMIPHGFVTNRKNQKKKVKYIIVENQGRDIVADIALPLDFDK